MTKTTTIVNTTRNSTLCTGATVADTAQAKRTGLLNHTQLLPGDGLYIVGGNRIHTNGMKFPIDLVFVYDPGTATGRAVVSRVVSGVGEGRIESSMVANSVLELPVGTVNESRTKAGDWLRVEFT